MIPIRIPGATHFFKAPSSWGEEKHGPCSGLAVLVADGLFSSAWEPTPEELATLISGGFLVLHVVGGQPPVAIEIRKRSDDL